MGLGFTSTKRLQVADYFIGNHFFTGDNFPHFVIPKCNTDDALFKIGIFYT
jgi:hypothetical protein